MSGIKMSDCKFYVNEERRTVVCVIHNTREMLSNFIEEHCDYYLPYYFSPTMARKLEQELEMPNTFIGKAVCSPDDEWDEELGRKIAYSRAKDKCYRSFFKRANNIVNLIDRCLGRMMDIFNNFGARLETNREILQAQIEHKLPPEKE